MFNLSPTQLSVLRDQGANIGIALSAILGAFGYTHAQAELQLVGEVLTPAFMLLSALHIVSISNGSQPDNKPNGSNSSS